MVIIAGSAHVADGKRDAFVEAHRDLVARARAFPGCIHLAISADSVDVSRFNNVEVWESVDALEAWRAQADPPEFGVEISDVRMQRFDAEDGGPLF